MSSRMPALVMFEGLDPVLKSMTTRPPSGCCSMRSMKPVTVRPSSWNRKRSSAAKISQNTAGLERFAGTPMT